MLRLPPVIFGINFSFYLMVSNVLEAVFDKTISESLCCCWQVSFCVTNMGLFITSDVNLIVVKLFINIDSPDRYYCSVNGQYSSMNEK